MNSDISLSESGATTRLGCNLNGISGTPTLLPQLPHKARGGERRRAAGARVSPAPARERTRRLRSLATVKVPAPDIHCSTPKVMLFSCSYYSLFSVICVGAKCCHCMKCRKRTIVATPAGCVSVAA